MKNNKRESVGDSSEINHVWFKDNTNKEKTGRRMEVAEFKMLRSSLTVTRMKLLSGADFYFILSFL